MVFLVFSLASLPAIAGGEMALNRVWSALADVNGEFGSVESAEFSPDSKYIVTGSKFDNSVRIFRSSDGGEVWVQYVPMEIERVAWTRDSQFVAAVSEDYMLRVFSVTTSEIVHEHKHANGIDGLTVSHDGQWLVTGQERVDGVGVSTVFNTADWSIATKIDHPGTVNELDFSSDDVYLAAVGDYATRIWRTDDWKLHQAWDLPRDLPLPGGGEHIYINTRFSPDNTVLAVGATHGYVYLFDVASGETLRVLNKTGEKTETVEWTKDGRYLLVAGHSATIDFFATETLLNPEIDNDAVPTALQAPVTDSLEYMDFNVTGALLTTAHQDGTVQMWTYMSDDPLVNSKRHRWVRDQQAKDNEASLDK